MMNGQMQQQQPVHRQVDAATPIPITLPIGVWMTIQGLLAEAPWKTADPLLRELNAQITAAVEKLPQPQPGVQGASVGSTT